MMVSDGQLLIETMSYNNPTYGVGVIMGTGTAPSLDSIFSTCRTSDGNRLIVNSTLSTYLKTTLGLTIVLDTTYADVTMSLARSAFTIGFAYSSYFPTLASAASPTWMLVCNPVFGQAAVTTGNSWLTGTTYSQRVCLFTMGGVGSGSDITYTTSIPANTPIILPNLTLNITNVV